MMVAALSSASRFVALVCFDFMISHSRKIAVASASN
jgi:hypothetical protein